MRTILFFCGDTCNAALRKHDGICRYGRNLKWNVRFVHYSRIPLADYLSVWKPDGIITDNLNYLPAPRQKIPTVLLDANGAEHHPKTPSVTHDERQPAQVAADEFARLGLANLAYLPPLREYEWSDRREAAFLDIVRRAGRSADVFAKQRSEVDGPVLHRRLIRWLKSLPVPCGIFAANDATAELLLSLCPLAGRKVPEELAVIGVDNDERICENTCPSLTSVISNHEESGRLAAAMLDDLLSGRKPSSPRRTYGELGVRRRESTQRMFGRGSDIRDAVNLIKREACTGLKARDVLNLMKGSRRSAEMRFRAETGRTVLEAIGDERIERAKSLLADTRLTLLEIARACGYQSITPLKQAFEVRIGQTLGAWRKASRK